MQKMIGLLTAAALLATAMPVSAEESLLQRNLNFLLTTVPADGVMEVQTWQDGELVTQIWTTAQYAAYRAAHAAAMGRDYTSAFQGAPAGVGDQQYIGDVWTDHWGSTSVNTAGGKGLPRQVEPDPKIYLYGGGSSTSGIFENANECYFGFICSSSIGWTYPQTGATHGDAWIGATGFMFIFSPPFGNTGNFDGVVLAAAS